jgi:DNA-directed RNA polymerase subunit D
MIKITNYDKKIQKLNFATDMPVILANAIRRSVLEIPVMAIDDIEISKNDSALYDEIIAHRMGLIPIKTERAIKETKFKLKEKGPKTVYSTDIEPSVGTNYKLPITVLDKEQEIEIVANARLGKGTDHIKYSPGLAYYKHNIEEDILDYVNIDESGKISFDEEYLKEKGVDEEKIKKVDKVEELLFSIESWGQMDAKEIFLKAIEVLQDNLKELDKAISK